jgi:hypothetical protein
MNNQTVIQAIVNKSKGCIMLRFTKEHFLKTWLLAKQANLSSANSLKILVDELIFKLNEQEEDIGKLLMPLFEEHDFGHTNSKKHSLTVQEIRDGYIMLDGESYVILLRPLRTVDSTGLNYDAGVLYPLSGALESELVNLRKEDIDVIDKDLLRIIIKKKTAYEYIK